MDGSIRETGRQYQSKSVIVKTSGKTGTKMRANLKNIQADPSTTCFVPFGGVTVSFISNVIDSAGCSISNIELEGDTVSSTRTRMSVSRPFSPPRKLLGLLSYSPSHPHHEPLNLTSRTQPPIHHSSPPPDSIKRFTNESFYQRQQHQPS